MEEFQTIKPSPLLVPYVKHYWFLKTDSTVPAEARTVPTGHISIMFHRGERIFSGSAKGYQPRAFMCGQEKTFTDLLYTGIVDMICVVFHPIGAKAFFSLPMSELNGVQVSIDEIGDIQLADLQRSLEDSSSHYQCVLLIEQFLLKRLQEQAAYNIRRISTAINLINSGQMDVHTLAEATCLSYKQFNRVFSEFVGAGPKEFQRIVRFQKALFILQSNPGSNLAQLASECGYYDQPHLIKEFRTFSGYTPLQYIAVCKPYSDYFS